MPFLNQNQTQRIANRVGESFIRKKNVNVCIYKKDFSLVINGVEIFFMIQWRQENSIFVYYAKSVEMEIIVIQGARNCCYFFSLAFVLCY
jgi:hypothetical protein